MSQTSANLENVSPPSAGTGEVTGRSPVRVGFFSDSMPERNGAGAYYHDLAAQLRPRVEALEVFQPLPRGRFAMPAIPMPGDPSQKLITPNVFRISRGCRRLRPNIIVTITPGLFGMLGLYHAKRRGIPFITAFHTDFEQLARIYWNPLFRAVATSCLRWANRRLCRNSVAVLINNSKLRADVEALGASAVEIMGTPLAQPFLDRPLRPMPEKIRQICFAGRLAPEKNVDQFVAAAARFPGIRFVIGGEGPLRGKLEAAAAGQPNVRFTGWLDREQLIDLIDDSSLLVLPSKLETFGSVALEAMARGRPALVTAAAGIHDWPALQSGLFPLPPEQPLHEAIESILRLPAAEFNARAQAARQAAQAFNQQTIVQWHEFLDRHSQP